ncbi:MAG: hypothetical protein JEZ07_08190 [Phycisphaerae bacterium]|nr:hypothetical protein [Phycisphaerae bacterium]
MKKLLSLVIFFSFAIQCYADTIHVGPSRATKTIQAAIDAASDGDTILLDPVQFFENIHIINKSLTIAGNDQAAMIDGQNKIAIALLDAQSTNSVIKNIIVTNSLCGIWCKNSSPILQNLTIYHNYAGIRASNGANPKITSCIFANNNFDMENCQAIYSRTEQGYPGQGNIHENPLFVDAESLNFRLQSTVGHFDRIENTGWSEPIMLRELNEMVQGQSNYAREGRLTADELKIYYIKWIQYEDTYKLCVFEARRNSINEPFSTQRPLMEIFEGDSIHFPWISADGNRLYYKKDTMRSELQMATFNQITQQWEHTRSIGGFNYEDGPVMFSLTYDEKEIIWNSTQPGSKLSHNLWTASRDSIDDNFSNIRPLDELNTDHCDSFPFISQDGLSIYFTTTKWSNPHRFNIFKATRPTRNHLFSNVNQIIYPTCNSIPDIPLYVNPSQDRIYFDLAFNPDGIYYTEKLFKQIWIKDQKSSPCIATGEPELDYSNEPKPNGHRINMGAYGGTSQASKSLTNTNKCDFNEDGVVDLQDFIVFANNWLWSAY